MKTHIQIGVESGLKETSVVLLEQLRTLDKTRLYSYIGHVAVASESMNRIERAVMVSLGMENIVCIHRNRAEHN